MSRPPPSAGEKNTAPRCATRRRRAHDRFAETRRFGSLDGLRGIAILAVVWHHTGSGALEQAFPAVMHGFGEDFALPYHGEHGVTLFFAISGFLITTLLLRERARHGSISLRSFYARRALRIFPLYYAVLLAYAALVFTLERHTEAGQAFLGNLKYFASYTNNYLVALDDTRVIFYFVWSLAAEEQFYLIWPAVEKHLRPFLSALLMTLLVLLTASSQENLLDWVPEGSLVHFLVSKFAVAIFLGVVVAHLLHSRDGYSLLFHVFGRRWSAVVMAGMTLASLCSYETPRTVTYFSLAGLLTACVMREDHGLARLLSARWLRHVGLVSYGLYLVHMLAANVCRKLLGAASIESSLLLFPLTVLLGTAAATFSHRYFESWFLAKKTRFARITPSYSGDQLR